MVAHQKLINLKYARLACTLLLLMGCAGKERYARFKDGNLYVLADTNKLGLIDGPATYYNSRDQIVKKVNFVHGVCNGFSVRYFDNGKVMDSVTLFAGRELGFWYRYDSSGRLKNRQYYYFGRQLGHQEFYRPNGVIRGYFFTDFEKRDLVAATFNDQGKLIEMDPFQLQFIARPNGANGKEMVNVFSYLPRPPYCDVKYEIGITRNKDDSEKLFEVRNAAFIDTLLPMLDSGWTYHISCHIQQPDGSFNRVYIEEYGKR